MHKWCCKMPCLFPGMSFGIMQLSEAFWENKHWELDFILEVSVLNFFSTLLLASSRYHSETKMRLYLFTWQKICNTNNTLKIPNDYENLACSNKICICVLHNITVEKHLNYVRCSLFWLNAIFLDNIFVMVCFLIPCLLFKTGSLYSSDCTAVTTNSFLSSLFGLGCCSKWLNSPKLIILMPVVVTPKGNISFSVKTYVPCHHNYFFLLSTTSFQAASYFIIFISFLLRAVCIFLSLVYSGCSIALPFLFLCFLTGFCLNILQAFLFGCAKYAPTFIFISSIITFRVLFLEGCFKREWGIVGQGLIP